MKTFLKLGSPKSTGLVLLNLNSFPVDQKKVGESVFFLFSTLYDFVKQPSETLF